MPLGGVTAAESSGMVSIASERYWDRRYSSKIKAVRCHGRRLFGFLPGLSSRCLIHVRGSASSRVVRKSEAEFVYHRTAPTGLKGEDPFKDL